MKLKSDPKVKKVFDSYPQDVMPYMLRLRELVLSAARETEGLAELEETLKWGEPAYLTKHGSTVRIDWKKKSPGEYAVYFKCTSLLVPAFRELYPETFRYDASRAIVFRLGAKIPESELKHCIRLALTYHKVKGLPLLGAGVEDG